jgi:hypothetical protein
MKPILILSSLLLCQTLPAAENALSLSWTNNMLRISGSTHRDWHETTIPHQTELISATKQKIRLKTKVEPSGFLEHEITARPDEVDFKITAVNEGETFVDVQWFQPCMRVDRFTGMDQQNYISKSFIFTADGLRRLDQLPRTEEAIYRGGQVYVPANVPVDDVNPRPISPIQPANNLIGCFSADGKKLLATAWSDTQELFQGVIVCLHNDPRIGGLHPREKRELRGKV